MKTTKFFLMAALALTFAACTNEDNEILLPEQPAQPAQTEGITITATLAPKTGGAATRAVSKGTGDDAGNIVASWAENEHIAILYTVGSEKKVADAKITSVDGSGTATIVFTVDGSTANGTACTLVYPAKLTDGTTTVYKDDNSGVKDYADLLAKQDGTLNANLDVRVGAGTIQTSTTPSLEVTTQPAPQYSIFKFTVQNTSSSPITPTGFGVSDIAGNPITAITLSTATSELYAALPVLSAGTYLFLAYVGEPLFAKANVATATTAGKFYQTTVKMKPAVDLSMVDCAGAARTGGMSTANCYMVHEAGLYKLPLVYGNAIKDGAVNTTAFNPGGTTSETYCANFVNHARKAISDPWIKNNKDASDDNITVSTAELLWQDAEGLITAVGISGDYLLLTVGKDAATQQGNALVAAKDAAGNIVWSWHIWVTTETFATLTTVATGSHNYQVTPVNLGWVPKDGEVKKGYNTFYQWGRKDPFKGTGATTDNTVYDISGTKIAGMTYKGSTITTSITASIADNIKNPTTHYYITSTSGPCDKQYYNMWDAQQTETGNIAAATVKTVYDPCPAGFCVPTGNLYYFMGNGGNGGSRTMSTWDITNKGATWDNTVVANSITGNALFFPASGYRNNSSGSLGSVGSYGYYWSASANSSDYGHYLGFRSTSWGWYNESRAYGFPVRAVAEE